MRQLQIYFMFLDLISLFNELKLASKGALVAGSAKIGINAANGIRLKSSFVTI